MRILCYLLFILLFLGCDKDDNIQYPKSYTYQETIQAEEGLYVVTASDHAEPIPLSSGTYGQYGQELKDEVALVMGEILNIHLIELLDENSIHLHMTFDEEELDTIVNYTIEEKEMIIEGLQGIQLFYYNVDEDQFEYCSKTQFAIPGPNVINPGQQYDIYSVDQCLADHDLDEYLATMLENFSYAQGDTLGIFITKLIYK